MDGLRMEVRRKDISPRVAYLIEWTTYHHYVGGAPIPIADVAAQEGMVCLFKNFPRLADREECPIRPPGKRVRR